MKNKFLLGTVAGLSCLTFLTGCGSKKNVTCTADFEEDGHKYVGEIIAELDDNDKIKDASVSMNFEKEEDATQMYNSYKMILSFAEGMAEEGDAEVPKIDIKQNGKKVTISNFAELSKIQSEDEDNTNIIGMKKDEFIKTIEAREDAKWSCK